MLLWIVRNEHLNLSHRVFSTALLPPEIPQPVWNRSSASPTQPLSGKWPARLYALEICLAFLGIWNKQRTNCAPQKWEKKELYGALSCNYIYSSPTWHNVRTRDLFVGNYCIFQVRIALFLMRDCFLLKQAIMWFSIEVVSLLLLRML